MWKCKTCIEKESRIADLKEQISYFRSVLNPPPRISKYELEETVVMNGGGQEEIDTTAEEIENSKIQKETDFIFSGNAESSEE